MNFFGSPPFSPERLREPASTAVISPLNVSALARFPLSLPDADDTTASAITTHATAISQLLMTVSLSVLFRTEGFPAQPV